MLTPEFDVNQCNQYVILTIHAPYTNVKDVELSIDDNLVSFYAKPYLLRLAFSNNVNDEGSSCKYDVDSGNYIIYVKKTEQGKIFKNLDLLTTLLCNKKPKRQCPLIEVVNDKLVLPEVSQKLSILWDCSGVVQDSYGLGFANKVHSISVQETLQEVIFVKNPNQVSTQNRCLLRVELESEKFDASHYLADLYEDELVNKVIRFKPWWEKKDIDLSFSNYENKILQGFSNQEYLLDESETKLVFLGLVDILFGFVYNVRETEDDENVESSWTIRTISSTLSCCDTALTIQETLITVFRRLLCYPQHRSWNLAEVLKRDVITILNLGTRCVLKCLLKIHSIFREADSAPYYLLNDLYITDYCVWIQKQFDCDNILKSLSRALHDVVITKSDVDLELDIVEEAGRLVVEESTQNCSNKSTVMADKVICQLTSLSL